jgi:hypothetical protein
MEILHINLFPTVGNMEHDIIFRNKTVVVQRMGGDGKFRNINVQYITKKDGNQTTCNDIYCM